MKDKEFLQWIHDRLVHVHGESEYVDYMHKLRAIIAATDPEQLSPNTCSTCTSDIIENIIDDFTITPDGNMTYHGDKPIHVGVGVIFNPGDSLVRAHTVEESELCGANESLVNINPKVVEPVDSITVTGCEAVNDYPEFLVNPFKDDGITDHELDEPVEDKSEWNVGDECMCDHTDRMVCIRYVFNDEVCVSGSRGLEIFNISSLRPIKTPKEKAIEEMLALDPYDPCSAPLTSRSQFCEMLYDARYRIQESDDE